MTNSRSPNSSVTSAWVRVSRASTSSAASSASLSSTSIGRGPVKADPRGAFLQLDRAGQRGQAQRHAVQHPRRPALGGLDALPSRRSAVRRDLSRLSSPKTCGWRASILSEIARDDIVKAEKPGLRRPSGRDRRPATADRPTRPAIRPRPARSMASATSCASSMRIGGDGGEGLRDVPGAARCRGRAGARMISSRRAMPAVGVVHKLSVSRRSGGALPSPSGFAI